MFLLSALLLLLSSTLTISFALPQSTSEHKNLNQRQLTQNNSCPGRLRTRFGPTLYTILPSQPSSPGQRTNYINITRLPPSPATEQLALFTSIPRDAQNCSLHWGVGVERDFRATGTALVDVAQLPWSLSNATDPATLTWTTINKMNKTSIGGADFTNWPEVNGTQSHIVGTASCAAVMAFRFQMGNGQNGSVSLKEEGQNGWFVQFDC